MASATVAAGRVTRNVFGLLGARIVVAGAGLVSLPVVYARLGPSEFGVWALLTGLVTIVSLIDLGLGSAIVRQVAATVIEPRSPQPSWSTTRITLGIALVAGVAVAVIALALTMLTWPTLARLLSLGDLADEARRAAVGLLCGLIIDGVAVPWRGVLEGMQRYTTLSWATGGTAVLGAGVAIVVVRLGGGLTELALSALATSAMRAAMIVSAARRIAPGLSPRLRGVTRADVRVLGRYGLRVQVTSASSAVNTELDRFILSGFFSPAVAGGFDLGGRLVNLLRLPPAFVLLTLFPLAVSRHAQEGPDWLDRFQVVTTRYLTAFAATGGAVLVVCADPLVRLWLGEPMPWASASIAILAPAYALNLSCGATALVTRVLGQPGRETGYALLSVGLNLALTVPLLHRFGPVGVPLATSIGVAVSTAYFIVSFQRGTGRPLGPLLAAIWPPVAAASAGAAFGALVAPMLPDGEGRLAAAAAVSTRAVVVLLAVGCVLAATGFLGRADRIQLGLVLRQGAGRLIPSTGARR